MIHVNFLSRVFYLELEIKGLDTCFVRDLNSSKSIQSGFFIFADHDMHIESPWECNDCAKQW